ncbi:ABC transporter permease [candidate division KSB1 bacterium]
MFRNYLRISLRNIQRHKGYSFINIFGLAIGMASCLLIFMYVADEISYDRYHEKGDRIYRVTTISSIGNSTRHYDTTPPVLAETLGGEIPEIETYTRFNPEDNFMVRYDGNEYDIGRTMLADTSFFNMFTYEFTEGNARTALSSPNTIVITEETAQKIFGSEDALGKTLAFADSFFVRVSGVIKNVPKNSHFTFNAVRPVTSFGYYYNAFRMWQSNYFAELYSYILLPADVDIPSLENKIRESVERNFGQLYAERGTRREYPLQPLRDIHLRSNFDTELSVLGNIKYVYLFSLVALFIICIASINFVNLSTARSTTRAKEVGLRKVFGAAKGELINQFMGESLIITFISMVVSIVLVLLALPAFNELSGKLFIPGDLFNGTMITGLLVIFAATGLLAGSFPAFVLSAFNPVRVMKGNLSSKTGKNSFRKIMVLVQFSISIFMIISIFVILRQMDYIKNVNLGYDSDKILVIRSTDQRNDPLRNRLLQVPGVEAVSFSANIPGQKPNLDAFLPEGNDARETVRAAAYHGDYDFINTYGLEIVMGRDFSPDHPADAENAVIVNEKMAAVLGYGENIIGKTLTNVSRGNSIWRIIGVVKDYHYRNLKMELNPLVMHLNNYYYQRISIRLQDNNTASSIAAIENAFRETSPDYDFDYYFLGDDLRSKYPEEEKVRKIYMYFGLLAIFVAVLGLFGLASYTTQQRTKEIGIKRVLGASVHGISASLMKEFSIWVLIANAIAWPLAYITMKKWLQNFAYRIELSVWFFILSGIIALAIALFTISYHAFKAARANPVDSLRYE